MRAMVFDRYGEPDVMHLRSTTPAASMPVINGKSTYRGTGTRDLLCDRQAAPRLSQKCHAKGGESWQIANKT